MPKNSRKIRIRVCPNCGLIEVKSSRYLTGKYCSRACSKEANSLGRPKNYPDKSCLYCKKSFYVRPSERNERFFCSLKCYNFYYTKDRIEKECPVCKENFTVKENSPQKFCSHNCSKKENLNPNWDGGRTERVRTTYDKQASFETFKRDGFTCKLCKQYGGNLVAHHLNNYWEFENERTNVDNLVTLCNSCHVKFHLVMGFKTTKKDFEYYQDNYDI